MGGEGRRGSGLGTGLTPIDSAGLKVRRDKRTGPDGAEEPLAATAYKGEREHGPGLVLSRGIRRCPRQGGKDERGIHVFTCVVCGVRAANGCTCGSRPSCSYLGVSRIVPPRRAGHSYSLDSIMEIGHTRFVQLTRRSQILW